MAAIGATQEPVRLTRGYVRYALFLLMLINMINTIDRLVIYILAEPIKNELHLEDWQIGLMTGLAFSIFLGVLGLPIARLADRGNRPRITVIALSVWSGFTVLCGFAQNFVQLCLCRMGVSAGEAGCGPTAHSLIVDYTPKEKRASALGFYAMGVSLGSLLGLPMAGLIADQYGWRAAFFVAGAPGLILAVVAALTLKETRSKVKADLATAKAEQIPIGKALSLLASNKTYWLLTAAFTIKAVISFGQQAFISSFFLRSHGPEIATLAAGMGLKPVGFMGVAIGLIAGICGALSVTLGGWLADRAAARDVRNTMMASAIAVFIQLPVFVAALTVQSAPLALALLTVPYLMNSIPYPGTYALTQGIVPPRIRAMAVAVQMVMAVLIGQGLGPLLAGAVSSTLTHQFGMNTADSLRWSLIAFSFLALPCVVIFAATRKTIAKDLIS